jgi:hypothetical protein
VTVRAARCRNVTWSAVRAARDGTNNALEDFFQCHRLIVVIADVHRVAAGMDGVGRQ